MALHLDPYQGDPGEPDVKLGRVAGAQTGLERRLLTHGVQVLAHGALVCPQCDLPLPVTERLPAGSVIHCGFCDHTARARAFLRADVYDTVPNEAYLVARVT